MTVPDTPAATAAPSQPLTPEQAERSAKLVEFYAASVQAWYSTAMEYDRSLVTLSAAAIGLITGLATTATGDVSSLQATGITAALVCFCITLACALSVFRFNKDYLQDQVNPGTAPRKSMQLLQMLDVVAMVSFLVAAVLTICVAISFVHSKVKVTAVTKETKSVPVFDSVYNAANLHPDFGKSFAGVNNMQPAPITAPQAVASSAAASAPAAPNPGAQPPAAPQK